MFPVSREPHCFRCSICSEATCSESTCSESIGSGSIGSGAGWHWALPAFCVGMDDVTTRSSTASALVFSAGGYDGQ